METLLYFQNYLSIRGKRVMLFSNSVLLTLVISIVISGLISYITVKGCFNYIDRYMEDTINGIKECYEAIIQKIMAGK